MATWHQQRNPVRYWHETLWTVLIDPPNRSVSLYRTSTRREAEECLDNLKKNSPEDRRHATILRPASEA